MKKPTKVIKQVKKTKTVKRTTQRKHKQSGSKALAVKLPIAIEVACDWDDVMISSIIHGMIGADFSYHRCGDASEDQKHGVFVEHAVVYKCGQVDDKNVQALIAKYAPKDEIEQKNTEALVSVSAAMMSMREALKKVEGAVSEGLCAKCGGGIW